MPSLAYASGSEKTALRHTPPARRRLHAAEAEARVVQTDFQRITQRRKTDDLDFLAFQQAHFQETLHQAVLAAMATTSRWPRVS